MAAMKLKQALTRLRPREREIQELRTRIEAMEQQLVEARRHQLRTAELTDVVEALLVPLARGDQDALDQVLRRYTDTLA